MTEPFTVDPIGHIQTAYTDRASTPVQAALNANDLGTVVLEPAYRDGLTELDGFDYAWLLTWLTPDPSDPVPATMRQIPFLLTSKRREIGLFAMRGPRRPNPIGLHLVRITAVVDNGFTFAGVDMLDGTPLLDIKPWAAPLDLPHGHSLTDSVRSGWFDTVDLSRPHTPASLRAEGDRVGDV
ncbi:MAG: SAM-dependent methyltransferase [Ilumatobacteraceae bacterium]